MKNYDACVAYIENATLFGAIKNNLDNIKRLLARLDNPQNTLKFIHVAGTNGKGSTCAMLESVLRESGYKTGLFTSPYLEKFTERIRIGGENISEDAFYIIANDVISKAKKMVDEGFSHPTFFELVTACSFVAFKQMGVDIAIIEVGIGGMYDSTNVIDPLVCVITNIGLDHIKILGDTIEEVARQKAGIIKPGIPLISGVTSDEAKPVIQSVAANRAAPVLTVNHDFEATVVERKSTEEKNLSSSEKFH